MAVSVTFGAKDAGLDAMNKKVAASAGKMSEQYKAAAREARLQEGAALKALKTQETAGQKYAQVLRGLKSLVTDGRISQDQATAAARNYRRELEAQNFALGEFGNRLSNMVQGYLGIAGAIGAARSAYQHFLTNLREHQKLAKDVLDSALDFALLQPPELVDARVRQVAALGAQEGVFRTDQERQDLFALVQSMQSATDDYNEGMRLAKLVIDASKVAIPLDVGAQVARQAFVQGQDPGEFLRKTFIVGQLGKLTPEDVARSIVSLQAVEDKPSGFAALNLITDAYEDAAETYFKAAVDGLVKDANRRRLGVGAEAPAQDVLRALHEAGVRPGELATLDLAKFGITEKRAVGGLRVLLQNYEEFERQAQVLREQDVPDLLTTERRNIDENSEAFRMRKRLAQQESEFQASRAFDLRAMQEESEGRIMAMEQLRRGREQLGPLDIADETGAATPFMTRLLALRDLLQLMPRDPSGRGAFGRESWRVLFSGGGGLQDDPLLKATEETNKILREGRTGVRPSQPES